MNSEVHKKPPLSPRTKKSASDLKEERRRLVKSEPRRRKRNSRESDRKKKHDRKRAPRLDLDNSTIADADDFGAEYLTVSMKPVRMTSRSGKLKTLLETLMFNDLEKYRFKKAKLVVMQGMEKKARNGALVLINTEEMERELMVYTAMSTITMMMKAATLRMGQRVQNSGSVKDASKRN